jgi:hypothetical protein
MSRFMLIGVLRLEFQPPPEFVSPANTSVTLLHRRRHDELVLSARRRRRAPERIRVASQQHGIVATIQTHREVMSGYWQGEGPCAAS